jgi:hypothetical protein
LGLIFKFNDNGIQFHSIATWVLQLEKREKIKENTNKNKKYNGVWPITSMSPELPTSKNQN